MTIWKYADLLADTQKAQALPRWGTPWTGRRSWLLAARRQDAGHFYYGEVTLNTPGYRPRCSLLTNSIRSTKSTSFQRTDPVAHDGFAHALSLGLGALGLKRLTASRTCCGSRRPLRRRRFFADADW